MDPKNFLDPKNFWIQKVFFDPISFLDRILMDPKQKREVDEDSFFHYLSFMSTPSPNTLFKGIKKLSPGTWMSIDENGQINE